MHLMVMYESMETVRFVTKRVWPAVHSAETPALFEFSEQALGTDHADGRWN